MAERWRNMNFKGRAKLVIFAMVPAVVLFACAEVFATLVIYREAEELRDPDTGRLVYTMRIGRLPWGRRSVTPLNSLGYPDEEFSWAGSKRECVHVVFSGDSYVFGDGVDRDSSFVALVKRWSAERHPERCVRMFNIAERASTIEQQAQRIRETLAILDPDIVILGQYQNDLTDLTKPGFIADSSHQADGGVEAWAPVRRRLSLFRVNISRLLSYHAFAFLIKNDLRYDVLSHWSVLADTTRRETAERLMAIYEDLYRSIVDELRNQGTEVGVVVLPSKFDLLAGRYPEEAFFIRLADEYGVPYLRLFPRLDSNRTPYAFLMYDGHLNEVGNRAVAEAVYDWLYVMDPVPFAILRPVLRR